MGASLPPTLSSGGVQDLPFAGSPSLEAKGIAMPMPLSIAIVAAACEFPEARNPEQLWQTVRHGRQCFRRFPPERLPLADYLRHGGDDPDGISTIEAALIKDYAFDRSRFVVPKSSFEASDMSHWLALDVADRALQTLPADWLSDAALKDRMAVIVANTLTGEFSRANLLRYRWPFVERQARDAARQVMTNAAATAFVAGFEALFKKPFPEPDADNLAGGLSNTIAGRIANHFGLRGGAHAVDGACASSLVAVITACEKIQAGAVDCVVIGAVDLSLDPFELVGFARNNALARGEMKVFDRNSNGFWPGEGCSCVILANEALARERRWPVLGGIRGVGMSTDGQGGLTRPSVSGQLLALRRAWRSAGLDPAAADCLEAHGIGTPTGDPVEIEALTTLVGQPAPGRQPVPLGSIERLLARLELIGRRAATLSRAELADLAATCRPDAGADAGAGASPAWRACLVAATPQALEAGCAALRASIQAGDGLTRELTAQFSWSAPLARPLRLAFLFPGQGLTQNLQLDAWVARFPMLAQAAVRIAATLDGGLATASVQPRLAELCIAQLGLLAGLGLRPDVLLGHSFGELSALHAAGCMSPDALRRLAALRGRCMEDFSPPGAMLALNADRLQSCALAAAHGVDVACHNGLRRHVLAGDAAAIAALAQEAERLGLAATRLPTDRAFHSRLMQKAGIRFADAINAADGVEFGPARIALLSTISGRLLTGDQPLAELLIAQFLTPVRFVEAVTALGDAALVIEPGAGLSGLVGELGGPPCLPLAPFEDSLEPLLAAVGATWVCGHRLDTASLYAGRRLLDYRLEDRAGFFASPCGLDGPDRPDGLEELAHPQPLPAAASTAGALAAGVMPALAGVSDVWSGRPALDLLQSVIAEMRQVGPALQRRSLALYQTQSQPQPQSLSGPSP